jgi:hypothetical protein
LYKNIAFTVFRKIAEAKGVSFENERQLNKFLSVFSVLIYIFGGIRKTNLLKLNHFNDKIFNKVNQEYRKNNFNILHTIL